MSFLLNTWTPTAQPSRATGLLKIKPEVEPRLETRLGPFCPYMSALQVAEGFHIALRRATDSMLHVKHLGELYSKHPIAVPKVEMKDLAKLPFGLFDCFTNRLAEWSCIYSTVQEPVEFLDARMTLLPGCRVKYHEDGYILGDIANLMYSPYCKTWQDFYDRDLEMKELFFSRRSLYPQDTKQLDGILFSLAALSNVVTISA